jgi:catechol 2,3-dioxygenase-like lactoylglutathione lyase family enzyme
VASSLSHVYLSVGSIPETKRLFVDLLGLDVLIEGGGYVRIGGGDGFHMGVEEEPDGEPIPTELVVRVDDVDAMAARLRNAGFDVTEPADQEWGSRHSWFHDADGRPISIYTPIEPGG